MDDGNDYAPPSPGSPRAKEASSSRSDLITRWRRRPSYFSRQESDPGQAVASPGSPRTPRTPLFGRSLSANFDSPGLRFKQDDDVFVFELGSRYLRAGIGGENKPRCCLDFGPRTQRRRGDPETSTGSNISSNDQVSDGAKLWGRDHELWQIDLQGVDLGLVGDKIDRAIREAIGNHIMVMDDSKKRKYIFGISSLLPQPLLSTLLRAVFNSFPQPPTITLISTSLLCTIAAGLRSALIVDIGWAETSVCAVYEYREVQENRSTRAIKMLSWNVKSMIDSKIQAFLESGEAPAADGKQHDAKVSFQEVEELVTRIIWCGSGQVSAAGSSDAGLETRISVPLLSLGSRAPLSIPFSDFSTPVEATFFDASPRQNKPDDEELPLPSLIYETLLSLPVDVRNACLSRIVVTGGGSNIPGLKSRLLVEVNRIIDERGWDPVENYGSAKRPPKRTTVRQNGPIPREVAADRTNKDVDVESSTPAHLQPPLPDPILDKIRSRSSKPTYTEASDQTAAEEPNQPRETVGENSTSQLRLVNTLGAWAGASLIAGLKLQGHVEIDRDRFMQRGLAPAVDRDDARKRQSMAPAQQKRQSLAAAKAADRDSGAFTLGVWA